MALRDLHKTILAACIMHIQSSQFCAGPLNRIIHKCAVLGKFRIHFTLFGERGL